MSYRLAKSLETLRTQLNTLYPKRSKISDGWISDAAHQSRKSDHNPWIKDSRGVGVVTALDITFDNNPSDGEGVDCNKLAEVLWAERDPRIKYLIWNRRITDKSSKSGWKPYHGANAHSHHMHISISSDPKHYDDAREWDLRGLSAPKAEQEDSENAHYVNAGASLWSIANKYGMTVDELKKLNSLNSDIIHPGQVLKIIDKK